MAIQNLVTIRPAFIGIDAEGNRHLLDDDQGDAVCPSVVHDASGNVVGLSAGEELNLQVGGIVKAARRTWPGYHTKNPFQSVLIPCGTAAMDTRGATGATSSIAIDTTVLWNGQPTTKVELTTNASSTLVSASSNATPSITLDANGQALLSRRFILPVRATNNTITAIGVVIRAPDLSNQYTYSLAKVGTVDGWELWAYRDIAPTTTGSPNLANPVRALINVTCSANAVAGVFHFGRVYVHSLTTPSVVLTLDDGTESWPWVAAEAAKRGIPVSFGITGSNIGMSGGITEAEIISIASDYNGLHEINNHNATHDTYTTLGLTQFMANLETNRARLAALGVPERPLLFHAYPSGDFDATLMAAMQAAGYLCGRGTGTGLGTRCALNEAIAMDGPDCTSLYEVYMACSLKDTVTLTQAKAYIEASAATGTAFVIGHKFEAAASSTAWIKGYDTTSGFLDLLDWLATKRDENGWILRRWSDWYDDQLDTVASLPL